MRGRRRRLARVLDVRVPALRFAAALLVFAAAGGLAAGCGGSGSAFGDNGALSVSPLITKARASAYAHAVNLRAADVPEMIAGSPEGTVSTLEPSTFEFARCYGGVSPARRVAAIRSPEFSVGHGAHSQVEESEVEVWPTVSVAARNNAAGRSSRERACFVRLQEADNKDLNKRRAGKFLYGPLTVSLLPDPVPGVDGSSGVRTIQDFLLNGQIRLRIYHDIFGFLAGPAEIQLEATGYSRPVPSATEQRLLSLLYSRASASKL